MPALRPLHWEVVARILKQLGFELYRTRGSHQVWVKSGNVMHVTLPMNRSIPVGTLSSIIRQMGITRDQFLELLDNNRH
jgi:predicted RNA binding protein YcfA (HicA-like mRNA interferase family)